MRDRIPQFLFGGLVVAVAIAVGAGVTGITTDYVAKTVSEQVSEAVREAAAAKPKPMRRLEVATPGPMLSKRVVEWSCVENLSTTREKIDCGRTRVQSWKCKDPLAGAVTAYRGGTDVTSANGGPESMDSWVGGDSLAYLVLASGTLDVRCVVGE